MPTSQPVLILAKTSSVLREAGIDDTVTDRIEGGRRINLALVTLEVFTHAKDRLADSLAKLLIGLVIDMCHVRCPGR